MTMDTLERELMGICKQSMLQLGDQLTDYVNRIKKNPNDVLSTNVNRVIVRAAEELAYGRSTCSIPIKLKPPTLKRKSPCSPSFSSANIGLEKQAPAASSESTGPSVHSSTSSEQHLMIPAEDQIQTSNVDGESIVMRSPDSIPSTVTKIEENSASGCVGYPSANESLMDLLSARDMNDHQGMIDESIDDRAPGSSHSDSGSEEKNGGNGKTSVARSRVLHHCPYCEWAQTGDRLRYHIRSYHPHLCTVPPNGLGRVYLCPSCPVQFPRPSSVIRHMSLLHGPQKSSEPTESSRIVSSNFMCKLCNTNYSSKRNLQRHMACIHGVGAESMQCPQCAYRAVRRDALQDHMRKHHYS